MKPIPIVALLLMAACVETAPAQPERPMDEVPAQRLLPSGEREYSFDNGCVVVLQARQAVLVREGDVCELYHRDIALLYASAD